MIDSLARVLPSSIVHLITRQSGLRKIFINMGWLFADNAVNVVAGLFVGAWVARYLGPTRYGIFNYALAIVALFTPFVTLGLKDIVIREIVRKPEHKNEILGTAFGLQLTGGLLALGLAIGIAQVTLRDNELTRWLIVILSGEFIFVAFSGILEYWFQSQVQEKYSVWARNIGLILIYLVKIGLILLKAPLIAFAWTALGQAFVFMIMLAVFYHFNGQKLVAWQINFERAGKLLRNSWPLVVSALAVTIYMKIGQVMLGNMVEEKELGLYSAAIRLSELWYFIPVAISSSVFPAIVRSHENDSEEVHRKRMQFFYDVMAGIAYAIVIPLALLAPFLVKTLFGSYYTEAGFILRVHSWALLFVFLGVARSRWLIAENLIQFNMLVTILGAITNIAMNFVLIPRFGGLGAAWAVVISQAVSTYLSSVLSRRLWKVFVQQTLSLCMPLRIFSMKKSLNKILDGDG